MSTRNISFSNPGTPFVPNYSIERRDTLILVPSGLGIDHKTDEKLRVLESLGYEVWRQPGYSAIDQCRNKMVYNFLTHTTYKNILWVDGDIIFEVEDVQKLEQSGHDIVGGTYPFKGFPQMTFVPKGVDNVQFGEEGPTHVEVEALATGFLFVTRKAITDIIEKSRIPLCNTSFDNPSYPLFTPEVLDDETYVGEDFGFCAKAKANGYKLFLDTTINLKHVGRYEYSWDDVVYKLPETNKFDYSIQDEPTAATSFIVQDKKTALKVVEKEKPVTYNSLKREIRELLTNILKYIKKLFI